MSSYREQDIALERGPYFAIRVPKGFEVYRNGITHAKRCAVIGFKGDDGLARASREIDRRLQQEAETAEAIL